MKKELKENSGMQLLIKKYKKIFQTPENQNHYSESDYIIAERKFLKFTLTERIV